jgi:hypothetical protein
MAPAAGVLTVGTQADNRRALLRERGRSMSLRRAATPAAIAVQVLGYPRAYNPGELLAGVQQGDVRVEITNDEIAAAAWPAPPRNPDRLTMDARTYTVLGAFPVYEGSALIGWQLWCRGA